MNRFKHGNKVVLGFLALLVLTIISLEFSKFIFGNILSIYAYITIFVTREFFSLLIFGDYKLSWTTASTITGMIKHFLGILSLIVYSILIYFIDHSSFHLTFLIFDLIFFLFIQNSVMYSYKYFVNKNRKSNKSAIIYGAGKAGIKIQYELNETNYKLINFIDDDKAMQQRSIDGVKVISKQLLFEKLSKLNLKLELVIIALPSLKDRRKIKNYYEELKPYFKEIKILPTIDETLKDESFFSYLRPITVSDLLSRPPKDLDKRAIAKFIYNKVVLVTGAGGSIGSEICRQCVKYGAKHLLLLDHSEYNLYKINEELDGYNKTPIMQSVVDISQLERTFETYKPEIVIHAAAYKHVPMVEYNIEEGIINNVIGSKNCIDMSIKYKVQKFVLISTDKAVRPTNVMGATKRICEIYAQSSNGNGTEICAVRFGNVLGSSGSVIPKFKEQIMHGGPITVTDSKITRYFMLIPEACELVLQAAAIGNGGEVFILDMGDSVKIVDLAKKMIELSGREDIEIKFTGLRPGEKLYEELLIDDSAQQTRFESITIAKSLPYNIKKLNKDLRELLMSDNKIESIKNIVPEFNHQLNN